MFLTCSDCVEEKVNKVKMLVQSELATMWSNVRKPVDYGTSTLSDFLKVEVRVLPHYRTAECTAQLARLKDDILSTSSSASEVSTQLDAISQARRAVAKTDHMESAFGGTAVA